MSGKRRLLDVKTGEVTIEDVTDLPETLEDPKGLDLEKVKQALVNAGIVSKASDLEPSKS